MSDIAAIDLDALVAQIDDQARPSGPVEHEETRASDPEYRAAGERTVVMFAETLAAVHRVAPDRVDVGDPAVLSAPRILDKVRTVAPSRLTSNVAGTPYSHIESERLVELLAERLHLVATEPSDLVLTNGRAVLDNLRVRGGAAIGFADWDRAALADRHRDLAVAASDVAVALGPFLVSAFVDHYTRSMIEPLRLDWYALATALDP